MSASDSSATDRGDRATTGRIAHERDTSQTTDDAAIDRDHVRRALDGDQRAFETLLARHEGRVLRVLRLLGVRHEDREDVAQEVFVRVFRYLSGYRSRYPFSGWIYRIAVNAVHDYRGQTIRRSRDEAPWKPGLEDSSLVGEASSAEPDLILRRRLEAALEQLSERERAVFVLREMEGLSTRDVARSLGITGITVRRHLGRARKALQRALDA